MPAKIDGCVGIALDSGEGGAMQMIVAAFFMSLYRATTERAGVRWPPQTARPMHHQPDGDGLLEIPLVLLLDRLNLLIVEGLFLLPSLPLRLKGNGSCRLPSPCWIAHHGIVRLSFAIPGAAETETRFVRAKCHKAAIGLCQQTAGPLCGYGTARPGRHGNCLRSGRHAAPAQGRY